MSKHLKPNRLKIVAVPIGNPQDLSPRAREALLSADRIYCEDTRKAKELFLRADMAPRAKLIPLPGNREQEIDWTREYQNGSGEEWALISDAGTPLVNDPGGHLLQASFLHEVPVTVVPGPCAPIAAWQWSGAFGLPFTFAGFPPKAKSSKAQALVDFFHPALHQGGTFCFFETKHQMLTTLQFLAEHDHFKNQSLHIARELTKAHEELLRGSCESLWNEMKKRLDSETPIGELTCLLQANALPREPTQKFDWNQFRELRTASPRQAAKILSEMTGRSVNECYSYLQGNNE